MVLEPCNKFNEEEIVCKSLYILLDVQQIINLEEQIGYKQNALLEDIGIDIDFSNDIATDIRYKCSELGTNGWVISPFWEPNNGETWYNTWYDLLISGEKEKIKSLKID